MGKPIEVFKRKPSLGYKQLQVISNVIFKTVIKLRKSIK